MIQLLVDACNGVDATPLSATTAPLSYSRGMLVLAPRSSSCSTERDAEADANCEASLIDLETLRPRRGRAPSLVARARAAASCFAALFCARRLVEHVTVKEGVVCVSRHLADRLVDRRRIRTVGLAILRHVDSAGQCARLELAGVERTVEIAGDATPSERDLLLESLSAALRDEGAPVDVRTIVDRTPRRPSGGRPQASAPPQSRGEIPL